MTKADMASRMAKEVGITVYEATRAIEVMVNWVQFELQETGKSRIPHLGAFRIFNTSPKLVAKVFNGPRDTVLAGQKVVKFKATPEFTESFH